LSDCIYKLKKTGATKPIIGISGLLENAVCPIEELDRPLLHEVKKLINKYSLNAKITSQIDQRAYDLASIASFKQTFLGDYVIGQETETLTKKICFFASTQKC
jgi:hypothetical protein